MEPIVNNSILFNFSPAALKGRKDNIELVEVKVKKYRQLLYEIARSFGFDEKESQELVQQSCLYASRHIEEEANHFSFRIWLSKILVYKCIFKISSELFSQAGTDTEENAFCSLGYSRYKSSRGFNVQTMPLSLRAVFILNNIGFNESEMAEILNTTLLKVKERLSKANAFLNKKK
ncbi:MAG TPA: sigma factor [Chitinophagaceae bacterium]